MVWHCGHAYTATLLEGGRKFEPVKEAWQAMASDTLLTHVILRFCQYFYTPNRLAESIKWNADLWAVVSHMYLFEVKCPHFFGYSFAAG